MHVARQVVVDNEDQWSELPDSARVHMVETGTPFEWNWVVR
jgi:hypothetical protein